MRLLQALGGVAAGLNSGMETERRNKRQDTEDAFVAGQRTRLLKQQGLEDASMQRGAANDQQALGAATEYVNGLRTEHANSQQQAQQQASPVNNYLTNGGTDGSMPDQAAIDTAPAPAPAAQPFSLTPMQKVQAAQIHADKLLELEGPTKRWAETWAMAEKPRQELRAQAYAAGMAKLQATGDPTDLIKGMDSGLNDSWNVTDVQPVTGLDGAKSYRIKTKNRLTGKTDETTRTIDDIVGAAQWANDPKNAAHYSFEQQLAAYKELQQRMTDSSKAGETRTTEAVKFQYGLADNADKGRIRLGQIEAEGAQSRRTKSTAPAEPTEVTLAPGATRLRKGKDGAYTEVATGQDKPTSGKVDWSGLAARNYGKSELGLMGGARSAGPDTARIAVSAQEIFEANKDKPGMTPEKALLLAAKQFGADK